MKFFFATSLIILFYSYNLYSMGNDRPGPNGGIITMPGTYHIELVEKADAILIYLLDLNLKNPIVLNSSVSLKFMNARPVEVICSPKINYFVCDKPKVGLAPFKQIEVEAFRNKVKSKKAFYNLPLKIN